MPDTLPLDELFQAAGMAPPSEEERRAAAEVLARALRRPAELVTEVFRLRRALAAAHEECSRAAAAAGELEKVLERLLESDALLWRLESVVSGGAGPARAVCRSGGQVRELPVHPAVDPEVLMDLHPWECVKVNPREMVVIGVARGPQLFDRAHGEVVELKGYVDPSRGLVRVLRHGHDEQVALLSRELKDKELAPPARLVLDRDDDRWAIAQVPADTATSRFEVNLDQVRTRFEDLAGLEPVIERIVEDVLLTLVHPEVRKDFDLRPLRGILLYSYKPGMGKTALARALSVWLRELGGELGFDVVLYVVKPNELKIVWHGGDAKLVREDLCGAILARQRAPRTRPLFQLVVMDEVDSLGRRAGGDDRGALLSPAQNDAVQALLAEMDGMIQPEVQLNGNPPAHVLWVGLTNRPDMVEPALKRVGRFGDLVLEVPPTSREGAESILAIYAKSQSVPWFVGGAVRSAVPLDVIRSSILRPALASSFDLVVLRYTSDGSQRPVEVTAGEAMASAHFMEAVNLAKRRAARRRLLQAGIPAITVEDVTAGLVDQALSAARQMEADRQMLVRQLRIKAPLLRVEVAREEELAAHRFLAPLE